MEALPEAEVAVALAPPATPVPEAADALPLLAPDVQVAEAGYTGETRQYELALFIPKSLVTYQ